MKDVQVQVPALVHLSCLTPLQVNGGVGHHSLGAVTAQEQISIGDVFLFCHKNTHGPETKHGETYSRPCHTRCSLDPGP